MAAVQLFAQHHSMYPQNGVSDERVELTAFINANLFIDYQTFVPNAVLVVSKGKVLACGKVAVPKEAIVVDLKGNYVYPSFIELYADYGLSLEAEKPLRPEDYRSSKPGAFGWNEAIVSEYNAADHFAPNKADEWLKSGFGTVLTHRSQGIARGTAALVTLHPEARKALLKAQSAAFFSFDKSPSGQAYPTSLAGAVALLRQTFYDAQWYTKNPPDWKDLTLERWQANLALPKFFVLQQKTDAFLVKKLSDEFSQKFVMIGTGQEWRFATDIAACGMPIVLPLDFPKPFDPKTAGLYALQSWYYAPTNAIALMKKGCTVAFTTKGLKNKTDFLNNLRRALPDSSYQTAFLKALLQTPADILGEKTIGNLRAGSYANFLVCSGNIFDANTKIYQNLVQGQKHELSPIPILKNGQYSLSIANLDTATLEIGTNKIIFKDTTLAIKPQISHNYIAIQFGYRNRFVELEGVVVGDEIRGISPWKAVFRKAEPSKKTVQDSFPQMPQEFVQPKRAEKTLIKNAAIWTGEVEGVLENTDILLENGKIAKIGQHLSAPDARMVDAQGLYLTAGIIDEHSHIALQRGVNEWSHSVTAEVRMEDALNSEDINIYRQLAGGVTAAQLLHGSANPIGGQSALIKLRYGVKPSDLLIPNADKFIKFALGENPKRSNWPMSRMRYPQTRMGVEQSIADAFLQAKNYQSPRRDLRLEVLKEILNGSRFITCHSYVESEILMLMDLAEKMGFKVNTFTHILEGYKVADRMKAHGAAGSTFADWWAYKYEVKDAIPYNAALMFEAGVLVAINSDDGEMGRRLNQEAAKAVKYGNVPPQEAWKMVTLNPAKMLHLDHKMGSIKVGKDADVVLWSHNPLSVYARAEKTWVDGVLEFDRNTEAERIKQIEIEKQSLILHMLKALQGGNAAEAPHEPQEYHYHCDSE